MAVFIKCTFYLKLFEKYRFDVRNLYLLVFNYEKVFG